MARRKKQNEARIRYGIGEWYGRSFIDLTAEERVLFTDVRTSRSQLCIPRSTENDPVPCTKRGGVCSLRLYQSDIDTNRVKTLPTAESFCTLCPHRLKERNLIFDWVGKEILGHPSPQIVTEVGFLIRERNDELGIGIGENPQNVDLDENTVDEREDVGQIDYVLINPDKEYLKWCALELQAVYFSGPKMSEEYETIKNCPEKEIPFPQKNRRPDYRSSGPKRLMPQLQIKVPTLRRWGKKMAVVVDRGFFNALGKMERVPDISNADIAWFIMDYTEINGKVHLTPGDTQYTTLERAVEGLTAGRPVSLSDFESRISAKLENSRRSKNKSKRGS